LALMPAIAGNGLKRFPVVSPNNPLFFPAINLHNKLRLTA